MTDVKILLNIVIDAKQLSYLSGKIENGII